MRISEDGMLRGDLEWTIEGKKTRSGKLYGLHPQEMLNAKDGIKRLARRGDSVIFKEI